MHVRYSSGRFDEMDAGKTSQANRYRARGTLEKRERVITQVYRVRGTRRDDHSQQTRLAMGNLTLQMR